VCMNGGWIPAGSAPPPAPALPSGATTSGVTCTTPDPSAGRPGVTATCVNGVWVVH
jgi:hypothetical protein